MLEARAYGPRRSRAAAAGCLALLVVCWHLCWRACSRVQLVGGRRRMAALKRRHSFLIEKRRLWLEALERVRLRKVTWAVTKVRNSIEPAPCMHVIGSQALVFAE